MGREGRGEERETQRREISRVQGEGDKLEEGKQRGEGERERERERERGREREREREKERELKSCQMIMEVSEYKKVGRGERVM